MHSTMATFTRTAPLSEVCTLFSGNLTSSERTTWLERFYSAKLIEDNWMNGKYRKKETLYVSLRTVRKLLWSQEHLALVYGRHFHTAEWTHPLKETR